MKIKAYTHKFEFGMETTNTCHPEARPSSEELTEWGLDPDSDQIISVYAKTTLTLPIDGGIEYEVRSPGAWVEVEDDHALTDCSLEEAQSLLGEFASCFFTYPEKVPIYDPYQKDDDDYIAGTFHDQRIVLAKMLRCLGVTVLD